MTKTSNEIRQLFLNYFIRHKHKFISSSSLVPTNDPTLLFTNAGMVQFKQIFLGYDKRNYIRAVSSQKCFRVTGKHNDLKNVGRTPRHHTFFEMLGNFSFGDYFKQKALIYAWELLTHNYALDPTRLLVSVHKKDNETAMLWETEIGIKPEHIIHLGDTDNFWSMGDTGPCGPCSEIYIDQGPKTGCGQITCMVGCNCDRYLELWNLVFMQFTRDSNGKINLLPKPSIDTGMGLERITAIIQNKTSNYDSDIFTPILKAICELANITYGTASESDISLRIIADHIRACTLLAADGISPSNEGRGYVFRRILRRACRHAHKIGLTKPSLHKITHTVAKQMYDFYPSLRKIITFIDKIILAEEQRFDQTLSTGLHILYDTIKEAKLKDKKEILGDIAFKLYDTYGFPLDLTINILEENNLTLEKTSFETAMTKQRIRSRNTWKGNSEKKISKSLLTLHSSGFYTTFLGYQHLNGTSKVVLILFNNQEVKQVDVGQQAEIITSKTPFYSESGGQIGDTGQVIGPNGKAKVLATTKQYNNIIIHHIIVSQGNISKGEILTMNVNHVLRKATAANHTAVHLLHAALRQHLGKHIKQAGSLVTSRRLRFDFNHFQAVNTNEIRAIERTININIQNDYLVYTTITNLEKAVKNGATAIFEERYNDKVRLVEIKGISKELCGGTHINRTGNIGFFKIINESSVAAGIRRLEALTGNTALETIFTMEDTLNRTTTLLKSDKTELINKVTKLIVTLKKHEHEIETLKTRLVKNNFQNFHQNVMDIKGIKVLAINTLANNPKSLREISDVFRKHLKSGIIILGAKVGKSKALLLTVVTKDLLKIFHAGEIIKKLAPIIGGNGGGKADLAQAGGQKPSGLKEALAQVPKLIASKLQKNK